MKGRIIKRKREGERRESSDLFLQVPQQLGQGHAKIRREELHSNIPYVWQGPDAWMICCLPRTLAGSCIERRVAKIPPSTLIRETGIANTA